MGGNCPGEIVHEGIYSGVIIQRAKLRKVISLGGNFIGGSCPEGSCPGGEYPGVIFQGEKSGGQLPWEDFMVLFFFQQSVVAQTDNTVI